MITEAERRFPVRIKLALPSGGLGGRLDQMHAWLDENCGADRWAMTPSGLRGALNDAVAIYFLDATTASWMQRPRRVSRLAGAPARSLRRPEGAFRVREDTPAPRVVWQHTGRRDRIGRWTTCNRCRRPTRPVWVFARSGIPFGNLVRLSVSHSFGTTPSTLARRVACCNSAREGKVIF
jgi:hypothetical protein